jgi:membrane fusion protein (multidrug efflux system)
MSERIEVDAARPEPLAVPAAGDNVRHLQKQMRDGGGLSQRIEGDDVESKARPDKPESDAPSITGLDGTMASDTRRGLSKRTLLFALLPVALVIGTYFYVTGGATMSTDNAYVQADMVGVSTDVTGIVKEVDVSDNQKVAAGDVLFKLDDAPFRLALDRTDAQLASTRNELIALRASYKTMQTQIEQAKLDVEFNTVNFNRQKKLASTNSTPISSLDQSRNTLQNAQQKLASYQQQLAGIAANLNGDPDAPIEQHPRYKDALAARDEAALQLAHTVVRAPFAGVVTNVPSLQPGMYFAAGTTAFNIVASDHVWVQANPKETQLTYVRPGQKASIEVDMYPGIEWSGTVESISPASASSFALLPAQNSSGNWVKVVQRIPLRVRVDNSPEKPPLRVGMSVELSVDTGHERGWPSFIGQLFAAQSEHRE